MCFIFSIRIFLACFTQCAGFLMVAFAQEDWMALGGVALTSFSSGLCSILYVVHSFTGRTIDNTNTFRPW